MRTKAAISQEELANLIGVSRQTYGSIERGTQSLTWNTYLSLILFYDYCKSTHDFLRTIGAFPHEIVKRFNQGETLPEAEIKLLFKGGSDSIIERLDEQAFRTIQTVIMLEYARCTDTPGEAIIRSFDSTSWSFGSDNQKKAKQAIKNIGKKNNE